MVKNKVDDTPRIERLASLLHRLSPCPIGVMWGLNMRQSETTQRVTCNRDVTNRAPVNARRGPPMPPGSTQPRKIIDGDHLAKTRERFLTAETVDPDQVRDAI